MLKYGVVIVDKSDKILNITEKSPTPVNHCFCPPFYCYYTKADAKLVRKGINSGCGTDAPENYIAWMYTQTTVYAMEMSGKRYDIGNIESYEKVHKEYQGIC
jgi:glucose-1-phosphate thymidylyltransferase